MLTKIYNKFFKKDKTAVLMYHRIDNELIDPWDICVRPEVFEKQLQFLQQNFDVLPLDQLIEKSYKGNIARHSVAITFDDGYLDNYTAARPLLENFKLPATFFIATGYTHSGPFFWWDELENICLRQDLPEQFDWEFDDISIHFSLGNEAILNDNLISEMSLWKWPSEPTCIRVKIYLKIWGTLKFKAPNEQQKALASLRQIVRNGSSENVQVPGVMTSTQIKELAAHKLFTIGAHTVNHPALAGWDHEFQRHQILQNIGDLNKITQQEINYLAYPFGNFNQTTIDIAGELKLKACFSTEPAFVTDTNNKYAIGRFAITNKTDFSNFIR